MQLPRMRLRWLWSLDGYVRQFIEHDIILQIVTSKLTLGSDGAPVVRSTGRTILRILFGVEAMISRTFRDALLCSTVLVKQIGIPHRLRITRLSIDCLQRLVRHLIPRCVYILMIRQNIILNPLVHHFF